MANFSTLQDVLVYALFRGGEFTSGTLLDGDFYNNTNGGQALKYVNDTMEGLLLGSPLGLVGESGQPMPGVDWWWARKAPLGTLFLKAPVSTGTATIRKGQNAVTFDSLLSEGSAIIGQFIIGQGIVGGPIDLTGYRIRFGSSRFLPRVASADLSGNTTACTLDDFWPDDDQIGVTYTAFKLEYELASDFLRFAGQPTLSTEPWRMDIMDVDTLDYAFPVSAIQQKTAPDAAALITPTRLRMSHYTPDVSRIEYPYIFMPSSFVVSAAKPAIQTTDLVLPAHYRRILGLGAAYYILYDKADSKAGDVLAEFRGLYRAMMQEHQKHQRKMSRAFGRINYRLGQVRGLPGQGPLRTNSGLIIAP